jgi:peptidoglycan/xylan/chitin deacetylase (PgdA/CDA1 family)
MEIYIVVTMDCERPPSDAVPLASGPPDLMTSEAWVRAYARRAANYDLPVSFFLHPEVAADQADLYRELEADGACLGMHLHPWKFVGGRYKAHFGGMADERLRTCLEETTAMWCDAIGRHPLYFRPGTFSANDNAFRILAEQGFRGGSISVPGRFYPRQNAIWVGAEPDPHRGHVCFRQLPGALEFANMPVSVDLSRMIEKDGKRFHWDLRPDFADADYDEIAQNIVAQTLARQPLVPVINMITHNDHDYTDNGERNSRNFEAVLRAITDACAAAKLDPVGTTIEKICDLVLAAPAVEPDFDPVAMPRGFFDPT